MSLLPGRARSITAVLLTLALTAVGAQRRDDRKPEKIDPAQRQDGQHLVKVVDRAMMGQAPASEIPMTWMSHFLKGREPTTFIPYIVTVEPDKLSTTSVALYVRVVPKGSATPSEITSNGQTSRKDVYPFSEIYFIDLRTPPIGQPFRMTHGFAVPPGEYDVYVALRERAPGAIPSAKAATPASAPKTGVMKQTLTVPDFWTGDLTTSSVILADRMEPLGAPVPSDLRADRPYALGTSEVTPALDTQFKKTEELSVIFYIYNPALDANKKPNLTVEYRFQRTDKSGPMRKTPSQEFNAQTLPAQFDLAGGHQIGAGQAVPLASFTEGEHRLEIVVKDNMSGKSITRELTFTVVTL